MYDESTLLNIEQIICSYRGKSDSSIGEQIFTILYCEFIKDLYRQAPCFTKKLKMRIRLRIKLIHSINLLKITLNLLKFALLIKNSGLTY